ncbi:cardioacceleratory peptide receptor-like [Dreissena polymorpha]|nr:cardioacceleratory peptide receptor-like [Dreissena polymorpha]
MEYNRSNVNQSAIVIMESNRSNVDQSTIVKPDFSGTYVAISVVCLLMAAVIISLNGLVIFIIARQKDNNRLHFFILHIAIADLCVGIVCVFCEGIFYGILRNEWYLGDVMCRIWQYSTFVVLIVSNNLLIGMSVDRYLAVRYPLRAITGGYRPYKAIIIGSWIIALLIPVWTFPYIGIASYHCSVDFKTYIGWQLYVWITLLLVFFIPFLAVSVCYVGISVVVWNHWRKRGNLTEITEMNTTLKESTFPSRQKSMNEGLLPKARITTIKMTLIICLTFFICWLPATVFSTMDLYGINELDRRYYMVLQRLYPLNSACNPIIFLLFSKQLLPCGSPKSSKATRCYESIETTKTTL